MVALGAEAGWSQQRTPVYSAEQLIAILKPKLGGTRSLSPGTGGEVTPPPGATGSGVLPDLQILFPFNSAELTPDATRQLDELGRALQANELAAFRFEVAGHTDASGPDGYNVGLSERRADAVTGYLEQGYGIEPQRLEARGYGKSHLLDPANPVSARNRRVEIVTLQ
jgi:outer membrane protein OmpA-like peptidoglycan-associated protein